MLPACRLRSEYDQGEPTPQRHPGEYTNARAHLDNILNLLENRVDI
jgi:hypothetical protein